MNHLSRRSFLKTAAFAAPAIIGMNSLVRAQSAREGKLGVALCGLGGFSKQSIAPELPSAQNVYFAGAITGNAAKGREWAAQYGFPERNIFSYADMAKLADAKDIAIVHVVTPNSLHAEHSIAAAKAGKHVMCEKPMATTVEQCEAMIAAAKAADVSLGVNYRLHWEPHHVKAIEALRNGAVGDLSNGNYEFSWGYAAGLADPVRAATIKKWLLDPKMAGGGALFDTGVYGVQAACMMTGKSPVAVRGMPTTRHRELFPQGVEETMSFELIFDDGFQALCRASYSNNFHQCTTLGHKGMVEVLPGVPTGSVYGQSAGGKPNNKRLVINKREIEAKNTLQLGLMLDAFARSITDKTPFLCPGEMGLRDVRIIEAIYASAKQGGARVELRL
ncbi:MAG: Glucose--fructose oxidoreductase precursor [Verrucomicrobiota bacterium]|jgi:glucose-fructose oxidoreductase